MINSFGLEDKLNKLDEKFSSGYDESARETVKKWRDDLTELVLRSEYSSLPITKKLIGGLKEMRKNIDFKLANDRKILELDRAAMFEAKDVITWFLTILDVDFGKEVKSIETQVDFELDD